MPREGPTSPHATEVEKEGSANDSRIVAIVEAIKSVGPRNCSLISRMTGIPIETVRYKIKKQLLRKNVAFHAVVDYELLGLQRYWVTLDFAERFRETAPQVLDTLSRFGLTSYIKALPHSSYETMVALPPNGLDKYEEVLAHMSSIGILNFCRVESLDWVHNVSLRPEYYDFDRGKWSFSWTSLVPLTIRPSPQPKTSDDKIRPDPLDLFILKELQVNSLTHLTIIARKLGVGPKTLRYHFVQHVKKGNLLAGYVVRWGEISRASRGLVALLVRAVGVKPDSMPDLERVFLEVPFTWLQTYSSAEASYTAMLGLPSDQYVNTLSYLASNLRPWRDETETLVLDTKYAMSYTIPYEMFDPDKGWRFDSSAARAAIDSVVGEVQTQSTQTEETA